MWRHVFACTEPVLQFNIPKLAFDFAMELFFIYDVGGYFCINGFFLRGNNNYNFFYGFIFAFYKALWALLVGEGHAEGGEEGHCEEKILFC